MNDGPVGRQHGRNCRMSRLCQTLNDMIPQGHIELFAIDPDPGPFLGRIFPGLTIGLPDQRPLGKNPGNNGQLLGTDVLFSPMLIEDLPRRPVEGTYILLLMCTI